MRLKEGPEMNKKHLWLAGACLLAVGGCSNDSETPADTPENSGTPNETPKETEVYRNDYNYVYSEDPDTFDYVYSFQAADNEHTANFVDGLLEHDRYGQLVGAIAESYDLSEDGLTYTFHLREDAKWSNGDAGTANDFVYAWRRLVNPNTASEYAFIMDVAGVKNAAAINAGEASLEELGVKAVDDYTLEVSLDLPVPYFLQLMTFPSFYPLNEAFVTEKGTDYAQSPEGLLANGPFKMTEWTQGHSFKVEKNDAYYDKDNVNLDAIEYKIMKDAQTAALEFDSGNMDIVRLSGEIVDLYKDNEAFTLIHEGYLWYIAPNEEVEELQNVNLRQA